MNDYQPNNQQRYNRPEAWPPQAGGGWAGGLQPATAAFSATCDPNLPPDPDPPTP